MPDDKTLARAVISAMMVCFAIVVLGIVIAKYKGRCIDSSFELEGYQQRASVTPDPSTRSQAPPTPALDTMGFIIDFPRPQPFHSYHRGDFQVGAPQYGPDYRRPRCQRDTLTDDFSRYGISTTRLCLLLLPTNSDERRERKKEWGTQQS